MDREAVGGAEVDTGLQSLTAVQRRRRVGDDLGGGVHPVRVGEHGPSETLAVGHCRHDGDRRAVGTTRDLEVDGGAGDGAQPS